MRFLLATDSVHTTAAACDYLEPRLGPDDTVVVVAVPASGSDAARDAADASNVATARLVGSATVETERPDPGGDPSEAALAAARARDPDVILTGPGVGAVGSGSTIGAVTESLLAGSDVPVVVVPRPE
ncbi:universal stress protein [Natronomonas sp.]|uniref:universal stress protein n=1 Tax=Natronomonas sp. TaxID=2184060 RepID=UPI0026322C05|nr:universal stress protein [Natronomonas sp.]